MFVYHYDLDKNLTLLLVDSVIPVGSHGFFKLLLLSVNVAPKSKESYEVNFGGFYRPLLVKYILGADF